VLDVLEKHKEIQYASRASHIEQQRKLHRLRRVIRELAMKLPEHVRGTPEVRELALWGCGTSMHVVLLKAPHLSCEDHTKDIDFSRAGISQRWQAGYADAQRAFKARPWAAGADTFEGIAIHEQF
jgi:NTE family protein